MSESQKAALRWLRSVLWLRPPLLWWCQSRRRPPLLGTQETECWVRSLAPCLEMAQRQQLLSAVWPLVLLILASWGPGVLAIRPQPTLAVPTLLLRCRCSQPPRLPSPPNHTYPCDDSTGRRAQQSVVATSGPPSNPPSLPAQRQRPRVPSS
jgi:hypothetical protein